MQNGRWVHIGNAQHVTMFIFFGFSGLMDILYFYKFTLPPDLDYVAGFLAFTMEGFIFFHHLHGRTPMDVQVRAATNDTLLSVK